jgi:hypothetical protein
MFWKMLLKNYWRCQKRQAKSSVLGSEVILGMVELGRPRMAELVVSFYSYKKISSGSGIRQGCFKQKRL